MHHGDVTVNHLLIDAVEEVYTWAGLNQNELVILYVTDCMGDNCISSAEAIMRQVGIYVIDVC